jgi:hypothetical protein
MFFVHFLLGKQCDCKSLHWKFSDKRTCDGRLPNTQICVDVTDCVLDCGHSPMQVSIISLFTAVCYFLDKVYLLTVDYSTYVLTVISTFFLADVRSP